MAYVGEVGALQNSGKTRSPTWPKHLDQVFTSLMLPLGESKTFQTVMFMPACQRRRRGSGRPRRSGGASSSGSDTCCWAVALITQQAEAGPARLAAEPPPQRDPRRAFQGQVDGLAHAQVVEQ